MATATNQSLAALLLTTSLLSITSPVQAGHPTAAERIQQSRDRQNEARDREIEAIEQKLRKQHGDDAWYVFGIMSIRPEASCSLTRTKYRNRYRDYVNVTIQHRVETSTMKVQGHAAAAEVIWQGDRSPVRYQYRVFDQKTDAKTLTEPTLVSTTTDAESHSAN